MARTTRTTTDLLDLVDGDFAFLPVETEATIAAAARVQAATVARKALEARVRETQRAEAAVARARTPEERYYAEVERAAAVRAEGSARNIALTAQARMAGIYVD